MERARFDWLAELGGASALGLAAGYAALKLAPSFALPAPMAITASGLASAGLGLLVMKSVRSAPRSHALPQFSIGPLDPDELLLTDRFEEPLLLQDRFDDEPLLLDEVYDADVLLLEDPLPAADPASRVVRLFAAQPMPTPGELKDRIDRHLAGAPRPPLSQMPPRQPDASEALYAALSELKRSLR